MCAAFNTAIRLTAKEEELFDLFRGTLAFKGRATVARVAGGWVRDKLLGRESDDIDIALDDQTGVEFASSVQEYLASLGHTARRVGVIEANPEQSKHLETATTQVLGLPIDFVNLRAETYASDTRIPDIRFGSPLEDALRRDFTVNALFFNVNTSTVEDLTGRGLNDLQRSILRTPLDPLVTFIDDPLRVLRAVRFASRFKLAIIAPLLAAAQHPDVLQGLRQKVSRERVHKEVEGMLHGASCRPALALELVLGMGLYSTAVFAAPGEPQAWLPVAQPVTEPETSRPFLCSPALLVEGGGEGCAAHSVRAARWFNALLALGRRGALAPDSLAGLGEAPLVVSAEELLAPLVLSKSASAAAAAAAPESSSAGAVGPDASATALRLGFWAAALCGLDCATGLDTKKGKGQLRLSALLLRDWLKADNDTQRDVRVLLDASESFFALAHAGPAGAGAGAGDANTEEQDRVRLGLTVRGAKDLWAAGLWLACARELAAEAGADEPHGPLLSIASDDAGEASNGSGSGSGSSNGNGNGARAQAQQPSHCTLSATQVLSVLRYSRLHARILGLGLGSAWAMAPLLDGKGLQKALGMRPGPRVGALMDLQLRWQLAHPGGTSEQLVAHLKSVGEGSGGGEA